MCTPDARREHRSLQLALKCIKHPTNKSMFPDNPSTDTHSVRNRDLFNVNRAHSEAYNKSNIPSLQRKLNSHFLKLAEQEKYVTWIHIRGSKGYLGL